MGRRIDLSGAEIRADPGDGSRPSSSPPARRLPLLALDIGGTLIKLVYTASCGGQAELRFAKFERRRLDDCFDFVRAQGLLGCNGTTTGSSKENVTLKATGGGSYKFGDYFRQKLGVSLDKLDEMDSVVSGANFLLQVTGNRKFERVTGTHIGGGTMFGLAKLLTGCKSYDEFLQLSQKGDNFVLDLVVKDMSGQGLSTSTLASSFGKVITSMKKLADYKPEDLASALLSAFTYNIAQISFLVASLLGLRRVFFGGSYIRGHKSTMDNISYENSHEAAAPSDVTSADEHNDGNIFPYLLVNIGSGVSMIERVIGSHLGGGTILGLARLLTGFERIGDNLAVDLTVGDIYGDKLSEYKAEDLAALLNSFTYNIGQIAYFVANLSGLKRIFFRGAYVCGHEKTMDKISRSLKYWSKGEVQTTFLCHEGFLGTLGAFWSYENMGIDGLESQEVIREVLLGAPHTGQFPSSPLTHEQDNGGNTAAEAEVERLRHDNTVLKSELERLQRENAELKAKLVKSDEAATM
ncbi:hypothetical protein ZWY2020_005835 [Hordeum vulgare]|nr:hypothetical protein ZWY2020_005835 [Hordeum vulgare]